MGMQKALRFDAIEDSRCDSTTPVKKAKDPGLGGLVRVMNKRQEFLWVHEKFASEY